MLALALVLALGAVPGYAADRGVYMQPNVGWAQKGLPGVVERFEGDMDAVWAYLTSPIANQQGAGVSYQQRVVAEAVLMPGSWQEWMRMNGLGNLIDSVEEGHLPTEGTVGDCVIAYGSFIHYEGILYEATTEGQNGLLSIEDNGLVVGMTHLTIRYPEPK